MPPPHSAVDAQSHGLGRATTAGSWRWNYVGWWEVACVGLIAGRRFCEYAEGILQAFQLTRHSHGGFRVLATLVCCFEGHGAHSGFDRFEAAQESLLPLLIGVGKNP